MVIRRERDDRYEGSAEEHRCDELLRRRLDECSVCLVVQATSAHGDANRRRHFFRHCVQHCPQCRFVIDTVSVASGYSVFD